VRALDADTGVNGEVRYSLADNTQSIYVDERTGVVRLSSSLDHELQHRLVVVVQARDGGLTPQWTSTQVSH
jgi:hypothetical protein